MWSSVLFFFVCFTLRHVDISNTEKLFGTSRCHCSQHAMAGLSTSNFHFSVYVPGSILYADRGPFFNVKPHVANHVFGTLSSTP